MTKFLDTYETWNKIFKITQDDNDYKIYIHDNCWNSPKMSTVIMNKKELSGFIDFLQDFINDE